jgi:acetyltransferase
MSVTTRIVAAADLDCVLAPLTEILRESVDAGASLGFLAPLSYEEARDYWWALRSELQSGSRLLLVAYDDDRVIGSGQLVLPKWSNATHRAELQKVFVAAAMRGRGVGRQLMTGLHDEARARGRSLLLLSTRSGEPTEEFYKGLGYREVGVIPGYMYGPGGKRYDNLVLYQELSG